MVDIDPVVVEFCKKHLEDNKKAFDDPRLELIVDDARGRLENYPGKFDVIIGDLADPIEGSPCYQLYTKGFYEMLRSKLNPGGVFITQSGPGSQPDHLRSSRDFQENDLSEYGLSLFRAGGSITSTQVCSTIHNTLKQVFPKVTCMTEHVPSFADTWSWQLAFQDPDQKLLAGDDLDAAIESRVEVGYPVVDEPCMNSIHAPCSMS
eukprot:scaffold382_cov380-Prasinococcus_capsulatus_cf.AAC.15